MLKSVPRSVLLGAGVVLGAILVWLVISWSSRGCAGGGAGVRPNAGRTSIDGSVAPDQGGSATRASRACPPMNSVAPRVSGALEVVAVRGQVPRLALVTERLKSDCLAPEEHEIARVDAHSLPLSTHTDAYLEIENRGSRPIQFSVGLGDPSDPSVASPCEPGKALARPGERFAFWCSRRPGGAAKYLAHAITDISVVRLKVSQLALRWRSLGSICEKSFVVDGRLTNNHPGRVEFPEVAVSFVSRTGALADVLIPTQLPSALEAGRSVEFHANGSACGSLRLSRALAVARSEP